MTDQEGNTPMLATWESIQEEQQSWARQRGIKFDDDGYVLSLDDNLFSPLLPETRRELESGKVSELGDGNGRGKMQALHSSSALLVNVFQYWRSRDVDGIARACGASHGKTEMRFERTHPTPLGGIPPHLDVEFHSAGDTSLIAIESKFTELYHRRTKREIRDRYVTHRGLWADLPGCERLARRICEEQKGKTSFAHLDAPQLLKHILGLATEYRPSGFELLYLWYDLPSPEASKHRQELREFKEYVSVDVPFRDMTYQELFDVLKISLNADRDYLSYLGERYFLHASENQ